MAETSATLHLIAGKIGARKSTLAAQLGEAPHTIVVSEDDWLKALYGDEMAAVGDYVRYSAGLRNAMAPHLIGVLRTGVSVVLDFPANTIEMRAWMRGLVEQAGCAQKLHYLDVPDEICKSRLRARNAEGDHAFAVTDEQFARITSHFVAPSADEGFDVVVHRHADAD